MQMFVRDDWEGVVVVEDGMKSGNLAMIVHAELG
jgi:hypothetical protein